MTRKLPGSQLPVPDPLVLQWGRVMDDAETAKLRKAQAVIDLWLQWGRVMDDAETSRNQSKGGRSVASMGPRHG